MIRNPDGSVYERWQNLVFERGVEGARRAMHVMASDCLAAEAKAVAKSGFVKDVLDELLCRIELLVEERDDLQLELRLPTRAD